ncbi:MAG: SPW repeat protein [Actinomycetota bacterium]
MSKWTHPQGLAALVAGIYAALSPIWTNNPTDTSKGTATMITLGVITAALALFDLALPGRIAFEGLIALMGVLFILSPWVMSFTATAYRPMAWTAWIVGLVALVAGAADVQMTRSEQRSHGVVTQ